MLFNYMYKPWVSGLAISANTEGKMRCRFCRVVVNNPWSKGLIAGVSALAGEDTARWEAGTMFCMARRKSFPLITMEDTSSCSFSWEV